MKTTPRVLLALMLALAACWAAQADPIPGSPNEIYNGDFSSGLSGWQYTDGEVSDRGGYIACWHYTDTWGDQMRQVVDDAQNPLWNANGHSKIIDLQADIRRNLSTPLGGGIRFALDAWDESFNGQDTPPTEPATWRSDWVEYTELATSWTTVNPFNRLALDFQPRWLSVEIQFLQPANTIAHLDNVVLTAQCVPEPCVSALMGLGLAVLGLRCRCKR